MKMTADSGPSLTNGTATGPRRSLSENTPNAASDVEVTSTEAGNARPAIGRLSHWHTERPKPTAKDPILSPGLQRHATNLSALKGAVWPRPVDNEDSTTSSSSDSDLSIDEDKRECKSSGAKNYHGQRRKGDRNSYSKFNVGNEDYNSRGRVSKRDGRLNISVSETNNRGYLAKALGATFTKHVGLDLRSK